MASYKANFTIVILVPSIYQSDPSRTYHHSSSTCRDHLVCFVIRLLMILFKYAKYGTNYFIARFCRDCFPFLAYSHSLRSVHLTAPVCVLP
jgi:hypothetical protein